MTQRELAERTVLDEGFTSRIVKKLIADRLVTRDQEGLVRVVTPDALLDAWVQSYDFSQHRIVAGHVSAKSGEDVLLRVTQVLRKYEVQHAATGLSAAWQLTRFASFRLVTIFVPEEPRESVLKEAGFRREERGANVQLVVPKDEGVFAEASVRAEVHCVHPVQAYVDLKSQPERSAEAAEELRNRYLQWKT
jgi:hypothetical protein